MNMTTEWTTRLEWLGGALVCYLIALIVYRLFFSPVAGFPGSKLAAATAWYEFWYDVIKPGQYFLRIAQMHDKYGPIIRINPWELSVRDASFYNSVYVSGAVRRSQNWPPYFAGIGIDGSVPVTENHRLHRLRRRGVEPFFARRKMKDHEKVIASELKILDQRLCNMAGSGVVLDMETVYNALAGDVIAKISVPNPPNLIMDPDFSPGWSRTLSRFFRQALIYVQFGAILSWIQRIPISILLRVIPDAAEFKRLVEMVIEHVEDSIRRRKEGQIGIDGKDLTLIEHLLMSDMPESEKSKSRLTGEFLAIFSAGTGTTARALSTITYFVLAKPEIENRLRDSLKGVMADYPDRMPKPEELEMNALLVGCVKEGLRLSQGTMRRLPRVFPDADLPYGQWTIPMNCPVGMSAYYMHLDDEVYPTPFEFLPDRWIDQTNPLVERNFVPFSRGSRNCLGMNLANAELLMTLAVLFRPDGPKMTLFETDESDVLPMHDFFLAVPKLSSKGMRVML